MDLNQFLTNTPLLSTLSKEFELLKKSGANVDYEAWVRQRIREAARSTTATKATAAPVAHALQTAAAAVLPPAPATREAPAAAAAPLHVDQPTQLVPSIRPNRRGTVMMTHQVLPVQVETVAGGIQLAGEGLRPPHFVAPAQPGARSAVAGPAAGTARATAAAGPSRHQAAAAPSTQPVFISKLYNSRGDVWANQPETSVSGHYTGQRDQHGRPARPDWAAAAALQNALRGSSAVPHLQAAAERERRLALVTALAKEQVALGLTPESAAAGSGEVARAEVAQVLHVAQQIAQQHEGLAKAVQDTHEQLKEHQALLQAALQGKGGPALAQGEVAQDTAPVPDAWFVRAAQPSSQAGGRHGAGQDAGAGAAGAAAQRKREKKERLKAGLRQLLLNGDGRPGRSGAAGQARGVAASSRYGMAGQGQVRGATSVHQLLQALRAQARRAGPGYPHDGGVLPPAPDTQQQWDQPAQHAHPRPTWGPWLHATSSPTQGVPPCHQGGSGPCATLPAAFGTQIEEEAARVVAADRAAAAERERLHKLEVLETRLGDLASKLEGQLERATTPQQQTQPQQPQQAQMQTHQAQLQLQQGVQVAAQPQAPVGAVVLGPKQQAPQQPPQQPPQLSVTDLHLIMSQLQRMEEQEAVLRRKWLAPPSYAEHTTATAAAPAAGAGTSAGTVQGQASQAGQVGAQAAAPRPAGLLVSDGLMHTAAGASERGASSTTSGVHGSCGAGVVAAGRGALQDPVPGGMVESVLESRHQFLRYQKLRDGALMAASDPGLTPVDIVEDITVVLLEELLAGQAADLLAVCDTLGEHLFDSEFESFA